ncbi:MAG: hypothetical protein V8R73_14215 [Eubacterium ramulus]
MKLFQNPYNDRTSYFIEYEGTTTKDGALKLCHVTPVFEKLPEMAHQISLVQTTWEEPSARCVPEPRHIL